MVYRRWHLASLLLAVASTSLSSVLAESAGYHLRIHVFESGDADVALSDSSASADSSGNDDSEEPDADDGPDGVGDGFDIDWTNWTWPNDVTSDVWGDSIGPFGQCGGTGYEGNETCILDWVCVPLADTFSECLPADWVPASDASTSGSASPPPSSKDPSSTGSGSHGPPPPATEKPVAPSKDGSKTGSSPHDSSSSSGSDEPDPDIPPPSTPPATPLPSSSESPMPTKSPATNPPKPHDVFQFDTVPSWLQCGGRDFNYFQYASGTFPDGDTTKLRCWDGYQCDVINEWFFQCVPIHDPDSAALWSQCGGEFYKGNTNCIAGSHCKFANQWYSQCVPTNDRS